MTLITADELARGAILVVFGGAAGAVAGVIAPGTAWWVIPGAIGLACGAATVPEVRTELVRALPALTEGAQKARAALPGVAWQLPGVKQQQRPQQGAEGRPKGQGRKPAAAAPPGALRPAQWLHAVNNQPDDNPHMTVVGPSGSGKTTFVSAALGARPGRVVVLTPKVSPAAWRGAEVVTLDDELSYMPIASALDDLQTEARRRAKALQRGEPLEPMTVVLDELPELHAEIPGAGKFAVRLSRWGRELQMRQVVIATSDDALNIPGWAATRTNYVRVELQKPTPDGARPAWLDDGQARQPLDLGNLREQAQAAQLRPWRGEEAAPAPVSRPAPASDPAALADLAALLAEPVSSALGSVSSPSPSPSPSPLGMDMGTGHDGVSSGTTVVLPAGHGPTFITLRAEAAATAAAPEPAEPPQPPSAPADLGGRRRRGRGGYGLDAKRRRHLAEQQRVSDRKAALRAGYAERKAAGLSYNRAWRELGGNSEETRAWWRAAPGPAHTEGSPA